MLKTLASSKDGRRALGSEAAQEVIVAWRSMLTNLEWETAGGELCAESLSLMNVDNKKQPTKTVQSQQSHLEAQVPIRKRLRIIPATATLSNV